LPPSGLGMHGKGIKMVQSIRARFILIFVGLAIVPLLAAGIILIWLSHPWQAGLGQDVISGPTSFKGTAPTAMIAVVVLVLAVAAAGISVILGRLVARRIIEPIQALTEAANAIGAGDLASRALIPSDDEMGILTGTFNSMARQLRDRIGTLEHRVTEQTKALATFREVSRLSAILDEKQLAAEVVEQIKNSFRYYHAQIYFHDESGENLVLAGGTGEAGQKLLNEGYKIPKGKGPAGRAAESNAPVIIGETAQDPNGLPNPLLPKTKSEAAIPIAVGDQVLGVLDVQQNIEYGITTVDADLLQSIANQVALAMQKAHGYLPDRQQAEREALIASINQKIRETASIENAMKVAVLELGRALGPQETRVVISAAPPVIQTESKPGNGK
jgi:putative methionine-R-sulfoxide reductase with GAF domain